MIVIDSITIRIHVSSIFTTYNEMLHFNRDVNDKSHNNKQMVYQPTTHHFNDVGVI